MPIRPIAPRPRPTTRRGRNRAEGPDPGAACAHRAGAATGRPSGSAGLARHSVNGNGRLLQWYVVRHRCAPVWVAGDVRQPPNCCGSSPSRASQGPMVPGSTSLRIRPAGAPAGAHTCISIPHAFTRRSAAVRSGVRFGCQESWRPTRSRSICGTSPVAGPHTPMGRTPKPAPRTHKVGRPPWLRDEAPEMTRLQNEE